MISFKEFCEQREIGLIEFIEIEGLGQIPAKIDSGNGAYNVLHGTDIQVNGDTVSFRTVNDQVLERPYLDSITIHVGAGEEETRPVVPFNIKIGEKVYNDIPFSIGDRSQNEYPILAGKDFISHMGALINVDKEFALGQ